MKTVRLAVPTVGRRGMRDTVSPVFARAATFTIIDVVDGEVKRVRVEENKASGLEQGAGPIAAKTLKDEEVDVVITGELGPGAATLLEMSGIETFLVPTGARVSEAVARALRAL